MQQHMKRCSASLIIKEIQVKITMRCHLTPARIAIAKKPKNNVLVRIWRKGNTSILLVGLTVSQSLWKTVRSFLKKLKMELPFNLASLLLGISVKKIKTLICKEYALQCPQQHCSQQSRYESKLSIHQQMNGKRKHGIMRVCVCVCARARARVRTCKVEYFSTIKRMKSCYLQQHELTWRYYPQ